MQALRGLAWLLVFQTIGEVLMRVLPLGLPGPVVGMVLLLPALRWAAVRTPVQAVAEVLMTHLSLLFVPVGVGVMTHLGLVAQYGWQLVATLLLSTWIGLAITALVMQAMLARTDTPGDDGRPGVDPAPEP